MLRPLKIVLWIGCLAAGLQSVSAFSPLGPNNEPWQVPANGFNPNVNYYDGAATGPKFLTEEYRRNVPVLYYTFDQNFLEYFGSNGVSAVEGAIAILNNVFTNTPAAVTNGVDSYSSDLSEFPLDVTQHKDEASALLLRDLKSTTLSAMIEQLGLAQAERYIWILRSRFVSPGGSCENGNMNYSVVKRNYDPITFEPSSYVNGTLYTYVIVDYCSENNSPYRPLLADAFEQTVDPVPTFAPTSVSFGSIDVGDYFTGLTRDDVGGLRYLLRTNNMNIESTGPNTTVFTLTTNANQEILTTLNLQEFLERQATNGPAALLALYPNLNITSVSSNFVIVNSTNFVGLVFTNVNWTPVGFPAQVLIQQQVVQQFDLRYTYTFGNVITNHFYTNWPTKIQTVEVKPKTGAPAGSGLVTSNIISTTTLSGIGGDFYILPPNVTGYIFTGLVITNRGSVTNIDPNDIVLVNASTIRFHQTITYFTNYQYVVKAIQLVPSTNGASLFQGIQKITFVRRDYDSLIGQFWQPLSNTYTLKAVVGNSVSPRTVRRVVTQPDFLFSATENDQANGPGGDPGYTLNSYFRTLDDNFNTDNALAGLAGPGTIEGPVVFQFNKAFPLYANSSQFPDEAGQSQFFNWGSFDGTTNAPIVYPNGTSLMNLENQILMHVISTALPIGTNGVSYNGGGFQLTGTGGSPPYTWGLASGSAALPPGLSLSPDGIISGTPLNAAVFDFTVKMTDGGARSVEQPLFIMVQP